MQLARMPRKRNRPERADRGPGPDGSFGQRGGALPPPFNSTGWAWGQDYSELPSQQTSLAQKELTVVPFALSIQVDP